jgi:hypothetical protein
MRFIKMFKAVDLILKVETEQVPVVEEPNKNKSCQYHQSVMQTATARPAFILPG